MEKCVSTNRNGMTIHVRTTNGVVSEEALKNIADFIADIKRRTKRTEKDKKERYNLYMNRKAKS